MPRATYLQSGYEVSQRISRTLVEVVPGPVVAPRRPRGGVPHVPEAGSSKLRVTKCVAEVVRVGLSAFMGTE